MVITKPGVVSVVDASTVVAKRKIIEPKKYGSAIIVLKLVIVYNPINTLASDSFSLIAT